jgi:hypothetical protein
MGDLAYRFMNSATGSPPYRGGVQGRLLWNVRHHCVPYLRW